MGEAEEDGSAGCSFSLMCLEDGADLGGGLTGSADDGKLLLLCSEAEEEEDEEYMDHLVSKESKFCCSPSSSASSSPAAFSDFSDAGAESSPSPMPSSEDWFRCARRDTVKWIIETRACFGFSHRTAYLAVAYFDRFCLHRCFDRSVMPWAARLLAVACVSLAAKMEEYRAPALSEFRADDEYDFSCASIRRMELLVLSTLGWRMGGVTPFDYLPCLSSRLRRGSGGGGLAAAKAAALIFTTAEAASVLDYRPSTVAVAAVLAALHGALSKEALESKMTGLSPSCLLDKEDVHACHSLMLSASASEIPPAATGEAAKRPPPPPSSPCSTGAGSSYESVSADAGSPFAAAARSSNKRARLLELPGVDR
ncbi:cyclin-D5-1-like [Panicum virgatum]|uniref:Cyclin-like domain-containing protein n=1 Tax=Panicum virgatum TaxID=38727 RepID=A0A8T0MIL3_PANVG|nr:cyclin-D5-1-like [Panicum virgatum]KAG2536608.1 hypothetical protein PVAP13_9NG204900 [Panicum virgatum]